MKRTHLFWLVPLIAGVSYAASTRPGGDTVLKQDEFRSGIKVTGGSPAADAIVKDGGDLNINNGALTAGDSAVSVGTGRTFKADTIENNSGGTPPGMVPIGGMVAVMPHLNAAAWQPPASGAVKDGFMRADGAAVPVGCTDCVIPPGTATPNMTNRYMRGNSSSGAIGGANTHTPTGTVSQPTFAGASTLHTAWFKNQAVSATGSFSGNAVAHTSWFSNSGMSLTFTGASTSYTVSVPVHSHAHSLASSLGLSGSAPSLSNNTVAADGHTHLTNAHYHGFSLTAAGQSYSGNSSTSVTATDHRHEYGLLYGAYYYQPAAIAVGDQHLYRTKDYNSSGGVIGYNPATIYNPGQTLFINTSVQTGTSSVISNWYETVAKTNISDSNTQPSISHTHGSSSVSGSVGDTGGSDGNSAFSTQTNSSSITVGISDGAYALTGSNNVTGTVGSGEDGTAPFSASGNNTPSGSVTMDAANDNMQEWAAAGSYTPSGSVSVTMNTANDNMQEWAATGSYTPTGTVSQPSFTGDSQNTEPAYMEVVWVVRVK